MEKTNELGIWMDHGGAYLMEFTTKPFEIQTIVREFSIEDKKKNPFKITRSANANRHKYYNQIAKAILKYDEIILFGPSDTKFDFFNILSEDERFFKLKIQIIETDKMDVNDQHQFINDYFI